LQGSRVEGEEEGGGGGGGRGGRRKNKYPYYIGLIAVNLGPVVFYFIVPYRTVLYVTLPF